MKRAKRILLTVLAVFAVFYIVLLQLCILKVRRKAFENLLNRSEMMLIIGKHLHEVECIANERAPELLPEKKMIGKSLLYGTLMELAYSKKNGYWVDEEYDERERRNFHTRLKRAVDIVQDFTLATFVRDPVSGGIVATNVPTVDYSYLVDESALTNALPSRRDASAKRKKRRSRYETFSLISPIPLPPLP